MEAEKTKPEPGSCLPSGAIHQSGKQQVPHGETTRRLRFVRRHIFLVRFGRAPLSLAEGTAQETSRVLLDYHESGEETEGEVDFKQVWSATSFHFKGSGGSKAAAATQTASAACYMPREPPDTGGFRGKLEPTLVYTSGSGSPRTNSNRNQRRLASCGSTGATSSPAATEDTFRVAGGGGCLYARARRGQQLPEPVCDSAKFTVSRYERLWWSPSTHTKLSLMKNSTRRRK